MSKKSVFVAARAGDFDRVSDYVTKGGSVKEADETGGKMTLLHHACYGDGGENNRKILKLLVAHQKIDLEALDIDEQTPLHAAARALNRTAIAELLETGVNPNARDSMKRTPLHLVVTSAKEGAAEVAKQLLQGGAGKKIQNIVGKSAGETAVLNGAKKEMLEVLGIPEEEAKKILASENEQEEKEKQEQEEERKKKQQDEEKEGESKNQKQQQEGTAAACASVIFDAFKKQSATTSATTTTSSSSASS